MANHLLVSTSVPPAALRPPAGVALDTVRRQGLTDVARAYWLTYLHTPHRMSMTEATDDVQAAWGGKYGRWLTEGSLLARSDDDVIGAILTVADAPWPDVPRGPFVIDLFVLPTSRRRGTGRALVQAVLAAVPATVALRVDDSATEAHALYATLGFRPAP
ncbi:MAG: GNAT family N-acetyltransferase [Actinotalea sp.]|nr:GNAT family N-acetyltransferase [Actinotalea sp.]